MTVRDIGDKTLAAWRPATQGCHIGFDPCLVDEDEALRRDAMLMSLPSSPFAGDIWSILFGRQHGFF